MTDWLNPRQYLPVTALVTNGSTDRSPGNLDAVVAQFQVETHPRYRPGQGSTWCATYVWDVTRALAAEIPHWWIRDELTANLSIGWLALQGQSHGWRGVTRDEAIASANIGRPTVVTHRAPGGKHGHMAIMLPGGYISQAGETNFQRATLESGFGTLPVEFWTHP